MAESLSLLARLGLKDELTPGLKKASGATDSFGSRLKSAVGAGAAMQLGMSAVNKALSTMSAHMDAAISRVDTMNNFPLVMKSLGYSAADADKSIDKLGKGIDGLPTSLDEIVKNTQMLTASLGDLNKGTDTAIALNDMFLAGGQGAEAASRGLQQYNQMLAKGKVDQQSWNTLVEVAPGQLNQLAKSLLGAGKGQKDLYNALQDGTLSMDDLNKAIIKLDKEGGDGFESFNKQALAATGGIGTAMKNISTAVTKGMANCIMAVDEMLSDNGMPRIAEMAGMAKDGVNAAFKAMESIIKKVDIKGVVAAATPYYKAFKGVAITTGHAIKTLAGFLAEHAGAITKCIGPVVGLVTAWKAFQVINTFIPAIQMFTANMSKLASGVLAKLAPQLFATGAAEVEAGTGAAVAAPSMLRLGGAVLMVGAGIGLAAGGLALLALSAVKVASAGWPAAAAMTLMVGLIGALAVGAAVLGPVLTAGAIGFVAFGAGVLMAGAGMALVATGAAKLAGAMPIVASSAGVAAKGVMKLSPAVLALGSAAGVAAPGLIAVGAAFKVASSGIKSFGSGAKSSASAMNVLSTSVMKVSTSIKTGMTQAQNTVKTAMNNIGNSMKSAGSKAFSNGANIAKGFARGINSQMGAVTAAVNKMVQAADKATRAKAKIHSPSRLFAGLGAYVTEGFAVGIESEANQVSQAMRNVVGIPNVQAPSVMGSGLNNNYGYGTSNLQIEVPLSINGREFARATASDMNAEISKNQARSNRMLGYV